MLPGPAPLAFGLLCALAPIAVTARAGGLRVALVNGDELLDRAATVALSPWSLSVAHVDVAPLPTDMPGAALQARALAAAQHVDAVAWISRTDGGWALWVYDAGTEQIVSRQIDEPAPADAAAAASVALTLKTLLRASTVAPAHERLGAPGEPSHAAGFFRVEVDGSARMLASDPGALDPRAGIALAWLRRTDAPSLGASLRAEAGSGIALGNASFSGRLNDYAVQPLLRARWPMASRFAFEPALGGAVHLTTLDGTPGPGTTARVTRVDPSLDATLLVTFRVAEGIDVGVRASGAYFLRYQRYLLGEAVVLDLSPVQVQAGIVLGASIR
jgi:hypothetical protein